MINSFKSGSAIESNSKWNNIIKREYELYSRGNDIRSDFERDYTRIIHSLAFRRMKHKTQVFFSPINDHICTRMEHVILVESISDTIASCLELNTKLTRAIAISHDIGHSPFGHQGESILSKISKKDIEKAFWHEKNGIEMVDKIILLEDDKQNLQNLNLTYGVRDGIISHCGEIDENFLKPREEYLDEHLKELRDLMNINEKDTINNTIIINNLVYDLCENSNEKDGLKFSDNAFEFMNKIKEFNYKYIYLDERLKPSTVYFELVLNTIYNTLKRYFFEKEHIKKIYPEIINEFENWLNLYWNKDRDSICKNKILFDIKNEKDFYQAVIYYISGMTDNYAIDTYNKIIRF